MQRGQCLDPPYERDALLSNRFFDGSFDGAVGDRGAKYRARVGRRLRVRLHVRPAAQHRRRTKLPGLRPCHTCDTLAPRAGWQFYCELLGYCSIITHRSPPILFFGMFTFFPKQELRNRDLILCGSFRVRKILTVPISTGLC